MHRYVRLALNALIPVIAVLALCGAVYVEASTAKRGAVAGCVAAKDQADSTLELFRKAVGSGPRKDDPRYKSFFADYERANAATYQKCLVKAKGA